MSPAAHGEGPAALTLGGLCKRFGRVAAVDGIDLSLRPGEIFGFLGPNGAGKTTTLRLIAGLARPTSGAISIFGVDALADPLAAKALLSYIPDRPYLYERLAAIEFLHFVGGLYGMRRSEADRRGRELLGLFDLADRAEERIEAYSHGMKQRLVFAAALLHRPRLIVVDEPMVGLDPRGARLLKEVLRALTREQGAAVFLSTHAIEVAEEICDRVAIIDRGRIAAEGTVDELRARRDGQAHQGGAPAAGSRPLEQIFLEITGGAEFADVIRALRG